MWLSTCHLTLQNALLQGPAASQLLRERSLSGLLHLNQCPSFSLFLSKDPANRGGHLKGSVSAFEKQRVLGEREVT